MVVGAFPLAKLGTLLIRQISKPIAGYIKERAKQSHTFRNYICLPTAQMYHWAETRYKLWIMGFGKPTHVTPLNEQLAVELGADILAEAVLFTIAAAALTAEYIRSSANSRAKEEAEERRLQNLETKLVELDLLLEQQRAQLRELERNMHSSPLRALKEKLIPPSTGGIGETAKSGQKPGSGGSTISAPPGPGSAPAATPDTSRAPDKTSGKDGALLTSKNGQQTVATGTVGASNSTVGPRVVSSSNSASTKKPEDAYTAKIVRRALKILMNAYEEIQDD